MPSLYGARELPLHRDWRPHSHDAALRAPCPLRLAWQDGPIMTRLAAWASGGRLVAWLGFVFGSVVSVLANVMDARLPPAGADASWTPSIEAQLAAAVWPLSLLLAVEAVARVRWAKGWVWVAARFGGAGAVALFSAWITYWHIRDVLMAWRYEESSAAVGPFVVDGLMVITGFALLSIARSADR